MSTSLDDTDVTVQVVVVRIALAEMTAFFFSHHEKVKEFKVPAVTITASVLFKMTLRKDT